MTTSEGHPQRNGLRMLPVEALTQLGAAITTAAPLGLFDTASVAAPSLMVGEGANQRRAHDQQFRQGFRVGGLGLMIDYKEGSELTELVPLYHVPNAPVWFMGMCNLHGVPVPVVDLASYFGLPTTGDDKRMLLALAHGADTTGVLIDGLPKRLRWTEADLADAGTVPSQLQGFAKTACLIDGQLWFDLDTSGLLAALEESMING